MFSADYAPFMEIVNVDSELKIFLDGWFPPIEVTDEEMEDEILFYEAARGVCYLLYKYDDILIQYIINLGKQFIRN